MTLEQQQLFAARTGAIVNALDEKSGKVRRIDYPTAERLLAIMLDKGGNISRSIARKCRDIGVEIIPQARYQDVLPNTKIHPSKTERTSHVLTAVDFSEIVIRFKSAFFVVRPSFTVCATMNSLERNSANDRFDETPSYSKVWVRLVELSSSQYQDKTCPGSYINSSSNHEDLTELMRNLLDAATAEYQRVLSQGLDLNIRISREGQIDIFSSDLPIEAFDSLEKAIFSVSNAVLSNPKHPPVKSSALFADIAKSFLDASDLPTSDYKEVMAMPRVFIETLRERDRASTFKLIGVDDDEGNKGFYIGKIHDLGAQFVGVARLKANLAQDMPLGNIRPSKASSNVVSAMLANDLVIGL